MKCQDVLSVSGFGSSPGAVLHNVERSRQEGSDPLDTYSRREVRAAPEQRKKRLQNNTLLHVDYVVCNFTFLTFFHWRFEEKNNKNNFKKYRKMSSAESNSRATDNH